MWRAVLRSMYSSGLNPLTSPAILQSKIVVSKCVIRPIPETPSIRFDQTVSTSFPIGVMKPMPVTATRRPLELDVMLPAYGRRGQSTLAYCGKTSPRAWTRCPNLYPNPRLRATCGSPAPAAAAGASPVFPGPRRGARAACPAVEDGVAVQPESGRGVLDRSTHQIGLQGLQQLAAVSHFGVHQAPQAVGHKTLRQARVLGQHEVGDQLVVAVDHAVRAQLSAGLYRLLGLEVRPRDASEAGMVTANAGSHSGARGARAFHRLVLELHHELAGGFDVRHRLRRPEHDERARIGCVVDGTARHFQ